MSKQALVTGGARGIGRSISLKLAQDGITVAVAFHLDIRSAQEVVAEIKSAGGTAFTVKLDITSRPSVEAALEKTGQVDILINNAGISQHKAFNKLTDSDWDNMMNVNLRGAFICAQGCIDGMVRNQWGRIINLTSIGGQWGGVSQVHYAASKAGLSGLTMSLARLYSSDGITINSVAPGIIDTEMTSWITVKEKQALLESIPSDRFGTSEEIASIVRFLASDDASYLTGQTINANGGMLRT